MPLDLKENSELIEQFIFHHQNVWPESTESIISSGIEQMKIYHIYTRLFNTLKGS